MEIQHFFDRTDRLLLGRQCSLLTIRKVDVEHGETNYSDKSIREINI